MRLFASAPLCLLLGCQTPEPPPAPPAVSEPWTTVDYSPDLSDGTRILVLHDMEGLSGQDDPSTYFFGSRLYPLGQQLLVADVNAVIEGLFAGGATEVHVVDGHGSGNPDPDVRANLLDPRATQVLRDEPFDTYFDLPDVEHYDGVAVVGMHAKTGSGGFASHTFTLGIELRINGQAITETELVGLSWGRVDVPVIFASGDDRLAADLETMPWIEFVTVKDATAADSASLRPVEQARADLSAAAKRAVENLAAAKVMKVGTPIRAALHAVPPADLTFLEGVPGLDYAGNTLAFLTDDLRAAYDGLVAIVGVARRGYSGLLFEQMAAEPARRAAYSEALRKRWFDQESGRYQPADPPPPVGSATGKFHGYR